jgi:hypothetical protein
VLCTIWREWRDAIRTDRASARWRSASRSPKDGVPELANLSG